MEEEKVKHLLEMLEQDSRVQEYLLRIKALQLMAKEIKDKLSDKECLRTFCLQLLGTKCMCCGHTNIAELEFHHLDYSGFTSKNILLQVKQ